MKKIITALLLSLVFASTAQATIVTGAVQPYQTWADSALVPTPPTEVTVINGVCPNAPAWVAACSIVGAHTIYLGPNGQNPHTFLHELGHVYDNVSMTDVKRGAFMAIMHLTGPWILPLGSDSPGEKFAEAYSLCARHKTIRTRYFGNYNYSPGPKQHARVCAVIRSA